MKHTILFFTLLSLLLGACEQKPQEISIESLLLEMVDREQITRFPESNYQCLQASSYNRESVSPDKPGWFADSDGVYCIRTEENNGQKEWVLMEDEGPGAITKIWAVCFYYGLSNTTGANINIYLDGSTTPTISTNFFKLVKGESFVEAPFAQESTRAGNLYFPIPYQTSCKVTMDQKVFYNIINYRKYPEGTKVKTFTMSDFEQAKEVRTKVAKTLLLETEITGKPIEAARTIAKDETLTLDLPSGSKALKQFEIKITASNIAQALRSTIFSATFDGEETVWAPVGDFFNNVNKVQPYDMWERSVEDDGTMVCRWTMPYNKTGKIEIKNLFNQSVKVEVKALVDAYKWNENSMHFYASWRMDNPYPTFPLFDWNFLSAKGKGVVVGDQWTVLNPREGWWGEGDEKIYVDQDIDRNFPSHFGTGTEDYYGWAGGVVPTPADQFSQPFLGNIIVGNPRSMGYNVCTRTRSLDAIPFQKEIRFDFESSCGTRQRWHRLEYAQTTFWYGAPGVSYNRKPLPEMASKQLTRLEELQAVVEDAKKEQFVLDGALEAEILPIKLSSKAVQKDLAKLPVWGEISNGEMQNIWFEKEGDYAEIIISEQFEKSTIELFTAIGKPCGNFDIYVNGKKKVGQDLYSEHGGISTPSINLGENEPIDNKFIIRFVANSANAKVQRVQGKFALGVDCFRIKNNFLNR